MPRKYFKKKVVCVETNQEWESRRACAKEIGISDSHLSVIIKFGESWKGYHYING